tara:strand:- start:310 stop:633 length:324 start_codon:yes stop_codon:yes gene_type:complete
MEKQEQRIAIAEACGYKFKWCPYHGFDSWHNEGGICINNTGLGGRGFPDYLNDLNAMHEAEKVLAGEDRFTYWHKLNDIVLGTVHVAFATAAQRAEAFLKTLNLWID